MCTQYNELKKKNRTKNYCECFLREGFNFCYSFNQRKWNLWQSCKIYIYIYKYTYVIKMKNKKDKKDLKKNNKSL